MDIKSCTKFNISINENNIWYCFKILVCVQKERKFPLWLYWKDIFIWPILNKRKWKASESFDVRSQNKDYRLKHFVIFWYNSILILIPGQFLYCSHTKDDINIQYTQNKYMLYSLMHFKLNCILYTVYSVCICIFYTLFCIWYLV